MSKSPFEIRLDIVKFAFEVVKNQDEFWTKPPTTEETMDEVMEVAARVKAFVDKS